MICRSSNLSRRTANFAEQNRRLFSYSPTNIFFIIFLLVVSLKTLLQIIIKTWWWKWYILREFFQFQRIFGGLWDKINYGPIQRLAPSMTTLSFYYEKCVLAMVKISAQTMQHWRMTNTSEPTYWVNSYPVPSYRRRSELWRNTYVLVNYVLENKLKYFFSNRKQYSRG